MIIKRIALRKATYEDSRVVVTVVISGAVSITVRLPPRKLSLFGHLAASKVNDGSLDRIRNDPDLSRLPEAAVVDDDGLPKERRGQRKWTVFIGLRHTQQNSAPQPRGPEHVM